MTYWTLIMSSQDSTESREGGDKSLFSQTHKHTHRHTDVHVRYRAYVRLSCVSEKVSTLRQQSFTHTHTLRLLCFCHLKSEENDTTCGYRPACQEYKDNGCMDDSPPSTHTHTGTHILPWVRLRKEHSLIIGA